MLIGLFEMYQVYGDIRSDSGVISVVRGIVVEIQKAAVNTFEIDCTDDGISFGLILSALRTAAMFLTAYIIFVLIPVFFAVPNSYSNSYAYTVSAAFSTGQTNAIIMAIFLPVLSLLTYYLVDISMLDILQLQLADQPSSTGNIRRRFYHSMRTLKNSQKSRVLQHFLCLTPVFFVNTIFVLGVNGLFVFGKLKLSSGILSLLDAVLSIFKLIWNGPVLNAMMTLSKRYTYPDSKSHSHILYINFRMLITICNSILFPCLATFSITSDCFYDLMVSQQQLSSSFEYSSIGGKVGNNITYVSVRVLKLYLPPFRYSYQVSRASDCPLQSFWTYSDIYLHLNDN